MSLNQLREKIDQVDKELLRLFEARMDISREIAGYKQKQGLPVLDSAREAEKLDLLSEFVRPDLRPYAKNLYETLFALSRRYQNHVTR